MNATDDLDAVFSALAHPVRRAVLEQLSGGRATVNELAAPHEMSLPAISRHIRVLENAGLITQHKQAQFRRCQLEPEALKAVETWVDQYRPIWNARFDRMAAAMDSISGGKDDE